MTIAAALALATVLIHPLVAPPLPQRSDAPVAPGQTWAIAGSEHTLFACRDVDGDGFDDVVVSTPQRTLLVCETVGGWKASPWQGLDAQRWPGGIDGFETDARAGLAAAPLRRPDAPPHQPELAPIATFPGDLDGDGQPDTVALYRVAKPWDFLVLRVAFAPHALRAGEEAAALDSDGDGLRDVDEQRLATDPLDRDSDDDGLLDGFEVHGLPRGIAIGDGNTLDPRRQDVICAVAPYEGVNVAALPAEFAQVQRLYSELATTNPDGSRGVRVHFRVDPVIPTANNFGGDWQQCGNAYFAARERGLLHWMQLTPWGGGQSSETSDMGGAGAGYAVFAHEFGHQLGLGHSGDSAPAWCPLYPSLMNYAFSYSLGGDGAAIRFSDGRFRSITLDERHLAERLPFPLEQLAYLAAHPFRFTLAADGPDATRIDWNQDGRFQDEPVSADINYGSSTHCGIRRDHGLSAAAPALAHAAGAAFLAQVVPEQGAITLKTWLGEERWSEPRPVPDSATNGDPLLIGTAEKGYLLFARAPHWWVARFDATTIEAPVPVEGLPCGGELGGGAVDGRVLLLSRRDDDSLQAGWLAHDGKSARVATLQPLELRSQVAPGIAVAPGGALVVATAQRNSAGATHCLRTTEFALAGERLVAGETRWVRGEASGTQCATRPIVLFDPDGQLNLFHTALPGGNGLMSMWRTRRIGNRALDDGWLTVLLYDVWTLTRRAVAASAGPQGALFAFRWDADGWTKNNTLLLGHQAFGIDLEPMRDFDDAAWISRYGLTHSILWMRKEPPPPAAR
ncbi:MAG: hypothetical protein JNL90_16650 [Planctomycetes bacterium]|nr:hypothetical protein [Planctomycetota bacterium]